MDVGGYVRRPGITAGLSPGQLLREGEWSQKLGGLVGASKRPGLPHTQALSHSEDLGSSTGFE